MHQLTLAEIARALADKQFSSVELTQSLLSRIEQLDPQLNSFITVTADQALEQAKACLLYTSPSPRDRQKSRMPSSA